MRYREFTTNLKEAKSLPNMARSVGELGAEENAELAVHALHDPSVKAALTVVPAAQAALEAIAKGEKSMAVLTVLKTLIPQLKNVPQALHSVTDFLDKISTYGTLAHHGGVTGAVASAMPAALLAAPALAAGHEKDKINANPNAPEYATNPYAMTVRGEAPTIAAAGNQNRRATVKNFATAGNPVPQQESLEDLRRLAGQ
jgi:hypothetical protein